MSVQTIIQSLENLVMIHNSLVEVSKQKTEIIKEGSVEKLQSLLIKERKHVQILEQAEAKRQKEVEKWFLHQQIPTEQKTITAILEVVTNEDERNKLEQSTIALTKAITNLKQQEQLNQTLIQQSIKFIQLSLDTMSPTIKNMNYGNKKEAESVKRSVFDSKA